MSTFVLMMRARAKRRKLVSGVTSVSLLVQLFILAWHAPAMALARLATAGAGTRVVVICTAQGLKTVAIGEDGLPADGSGGSDVTPPCSVCAAATGAALALPPLPGDLDLLSDSAPVVHMPREACVADRTPFVRHGHDPPRHEGV